MLTHFSNDLHDPALIQAFAAIVALVLSVVSIWLNWTSAARARREQAKSIALAILPDIGRTRDLIDQAQDHCGLILGQSRDQPGAHVAQYVSGIVIEILPMLNSNRGNLHLLGARPAQDCIRLISRLAEFNAGVADAAAQIAPLGPEDWVGPVYELEVDLRALDRLAARADDTVSALLGFEESGDPAHG